MTTEQNRITRGGLSPLLQTTRPDEQPRNADKNSLVIDTEYRQGKRKRRTRRRNLKRAKKKRNYSWVLSKH
jgi:hypothetical protein